MKKAMTVPEMRISFSIRRRSRQNQDVNQTERDEMKYRIRQMFTIATARTILKELQPSIEDE